MKLPSKVRFADGALKKTYERLDEDGENELHKWLERALDDIEENAFCGIQIPKKLIPRSYVKKYKLRNLWKYNLPNAWRLLYSVEHQGILVVSIILEWLGHKEYEPRFDY